MAISGNRIPPYLSHFRYSWAYVTTINQKRQAQYRPLLHKYFHAKNGNGPSSPPFKIADQRFSAI